MNDELYPAQITRHDAADKAYYEVTFTDFEQLIVVHPDMFEAVRLAKKLARKARCDNHKPSAPVEFDFMIDCS